MQRLLNSPASHTCRLVIDPCTQGRGTVVTGRVEQGIVKVGDEIEIVGIRPANTKSTVTGERPGLRFRAASCCCCPGGNRRVEARQLIGSHAMLN